MFEQIIDPYVDVSKNAQPPVMPVAAADFRDHVAGGWNAVHPAIRLRMDRLLTSQTSTVFEGQGCVHRNWFGWLFAQAARLLGAPLVWRQGNNVKTTVTVAPTPSGNRCWHRLFDFEDGFQQLVQTSKVVDPKLGFLDAVGTDGEKMLATQMTVWAQGDSLFFESSEYWLRLGRFKLKVPPLLTPGKLHAEHRDEGNGWFRYVLKFTHPLWGQTFYQDGRFRMVD
ncbi:MAG: DUF4166 domain-containing protein [Kordiimonadaceae bacterium]|nr:DUF4166 domain-containing protein [Kordiimonadaceae bacterium]MBO6568898.1 DUF4166 domain-containing protein [Kordiimonadaceae bacterium]MBO6965127.1 DUF4166 domain-containing protein [Kordiimonadaceae bacterium]